TTGAQNTTDSGNPHPTVMRFFYVHILYMAGRAANTIPVREICPPAICGFERLVALSKRAKFRISDRT
ncbi:hypothetical protein, partial [Candidatus Regiella insecticola]|uniref:hypothetical protein n=1 Tax=Candidatus Regiella insecticola TaxID=138073 RepID=UPI002351D709